MATIRMCDVRAAGHCAGGVREFCARYGIDLRRLVHDGIPADELSAITDANLDRVLVAAEEREASGE